MAALGHDDYPELLATTFQKVEKKLTDQILRDHPTLELFADNTDSSVGEDVRLPLHTAVNGSTTKTDASGTFSTAKSAPVVGSAVFSWADPIVTSLRLPWLELEKNSGEAKIVDLMEAHMTSTVEGQREYLASRIHALATAYAAGDPESLDRMVADAAYGSNPDGDATTADGFVFGGIDPSVAGKEYWQSKRLTIAKSGTGSMDIRKAFRRMLNTIYVEAKGKRPTHVIAGIDVFEEVQDAAANLQVVQQTGGNIELGFEELKFNGLTVRLDPDCQADRAYFLFAGRLYLRKLNNNFLNVGEAQKITGTHDKVTPVTSVVQFATNERRAHGLLIRS